MKYLTAALILICLIFSIGTKFENIGIPPLLGLWPIGIGAFIVAIMSLIFVVVYAVRRLKHQRIGEVTKFVFYPSLLYILFIIYVLLTADYVFDFCGGLCSQKIETPENRGSYKICFLSFVVIYSVY